MLNRVPTFAGLCFGACVLSASVAGAQEAGQPPRPPEPDGALDPYAHRVRVGLFPAYFVGGVTQSHFGSGARVGVDLIRGLSLSARGRVRWPVTAGEPHGKAFLGGVTVHIHVFDRETMQRAGGTIYPEDVTPGTAANPATVASGGDLQVPVNQRLGGPALTLPEADRHAIVPVRTVHTIRVGYDYAYAVQTARVAIPSTPDEDGGNAQLAVENRLHMLRVGYGFGDHWNLAPQATGRRELGYRHFFVDVLLSLPATTEWHALEAVPGGAGEPEFMPVGLRLGMDGALDALFDRWVGGGLAYHLEVGALPGYSGLEGYLLIALGLEIDS